MSSVAVCKCMQNILDPESLRVVSSRETSVVQYLGNLVSIVIPHGITEVAVYHGAMIAQSIVR